ncbi:MAG: hypothetical protein N2260_00915 [Syntrophobacterales bacterium]|nr:hypothetical protein [Syntrophobacterales bacterium]
MAKNRGQVIPFPSPAKPNIKELFSEFLKEEQRRLRPATFRNYELIIELLEHCLNSYGYSFLSEPEGQLYERLYERKNLEFCSIFDPEKIILILPTFLGDFMIRKVAASESLLRYSGTVTKRLIKWLADRGHIGKAKAKKAISYAAEATKVLPAAERLARLLYEYSHTHAPRSWNMEIDDFFTIEEIMPGKVILSTLSSTEIDMVELRLPEEILSHCRVGWQINLLLGKTSRGWQIIESGSVYPDLF